VAPENPLAPTRLPAEILTNLPRLTKRAAKGDKTARQQLRQALDRPNCFQLFRDLAGTVREGLIRKFAGDDWIVRELEVHTAEH
jgi:hypothetical protein